MTDDSTEETAAMIHVRFFGSIKESAGISSVDMELTPDTTLFDFLLTLAEKYGKELHSEILDESTSSGLRGDLMLTHNDVIINHEIVTGVILNPGDSVALLPTFPGGG